MVLLAQCEASDAVRMLVQAFISCCLHYYNSLFFGISDRLMTWLQSVQNAAAHLVSGARRYDHISPVLHQLHWLLVLEAGAGWNLRFPPWSITHCLAWRHCTWPQTVSSSPMRLDLGCVWLALGHVSSDRPTASLVTDVLLLQAPSCGTVFQLN